MWIIPGPFLTAEHIGERLKDIPPDVVDGILDLIDEGTHVHALTWDEGGCEMDIAFYQRMLCGANTAVREPAEPDFDRDPPTLTCGCTAAWDDLDK